jgi:hypothetical protein
MPAGNLTNNLERELAELSRQIEAKRQQ